MKVPRQGSRRPRATSATVIPLPAAGGQSHAEQRGRDTATASEAVTVRDIGPRQRRCRGAGVFETAGGYEVCIHTGEVIAAITGKHEVFDANVLDAFRYILEAYEWRHQPGPHAFDIG